MDSNGTNSYETSLPFLYECLLIFPVGREFAGSPWWVFELYWKVLLETNLEPFCWGGLFWGVGWLG
jgi:hypothetical protein